MPFLGDIEQESLAQESSMRFTAPVGLMPRVSLSDRTRTSSPGGSRLGERVRQLRVAAGLTQTDLAGERFSKEYVSQIERGKTRPTQETIEWLAQRLGVDPGFLASGVSADERGRIETALARAEALSENHEYEDSLEELQKIRPAVLGIASPELEVRALAGEAWGLMRTGEVKQ